MISRDPQNVYPGSCYNCHVEVPDDEELDENQRCVECAVAWSMEVLADQERYG